MDEELEDGIILYEILEGSVRSFLSQISGCAQYICVCMCELCALMLFSLSFLFSHSIGVKRKLLHFPHHTLLTPLTFI